MATTPVATRDPFPAGMQKLAAATGIVFAVLFLIGFFFWAQETPEMDAPLAEWTAFATDNESDMRVGSLILALAFYNFIWFLGCLRSLLGAAEATARGFTRITHISFAGGIVGGVGICLAVFLSAAALAYEDASAELIRGLYMLSGAPTGLASAGFAAMLIPVWFLVQRTGALPAWQGWLALVVGICSLLTLGVMLAEDYNNAFGFFFPLTFLGLLVFAVAASLTMISRVGNPEHAASPSASELKFGSPHVPSAASATVARRPRTRGLLMRRPLTVTRRRPLGLRLSLIVAPRRHERLGAAGAGKGT